jgi:hypothetical protein
MWILSNALLKDYENSLSLQVQEGVSLVDTCSDGEPSALSNTNPMPLKSWFKDRTTDHYLLSRSGTTYELLTPNRGEAMLTWFREDFLAKISRSLDEGQESLGSVPDYGRNLRELFAEFDPDTHSWKIPHSFLIEDSTPYSGIWPRWGMMLHGECWEQQTLERRIKETACGLSANYPTPTTTGLDGGSNSRNAAKARGMWPTFPTPTTIDSESRFNTSLHPNAEPRPTLGAMARFGMWPTPRARDWKDGAYPNEYERNTPSLATHAGGQMNPTWVELLMGWPEGWTCLSPISGVKYLQWLIETANDKNENRTSEILRVLRNASIQEEVSQQIGRSIGVWEIACLLSDVCKHAGRDNSTQVFLACAKELESNTQIQSSEHTIYTEQSVDHSSDIQALSRLLAHYGKKAWLDDSWENDIPRVANKVPNRIGRLKCIGNGQVPAVAATAFYNLWKILNP